MRRGLSRLWRNVAELRHRRSIACWAEGYRVAPSLSSFSLTNLTVAAGIALFLSGSLQSDSPAAAQRSECSAWPSSHTHFSTSRPLEERRHVRRQRGACGRIFTLTGNVRRSSVVVLPLRGYPTLRRAGRIERQPIPAFRIAGPPFQEAGQPDSAIAK